MSNGLWKDIRSDNLLLAFLVVNHKVYLLTRSIYFLLFVCLFLTGEMMRDSDHSSDLLSIDSSSND